MKRGSTHWKKLTLVDSYAHTQRSVHGFCLAVDSTCCCSLNTANLQSHSSLRAHSLRNTGDFLQGNVTRFVARLLSGGRKVAKRVSKVKKYSKNVVSNSLRLVACTALYTKHLSTWALLSFRL